MSVYILKPLAVYNTFECNVTGYSKHTDHIAGCDGGCRISDFSHTRCKPECEQLAILHSASHSVIGPVYVIWSIKTDFYLLTEESSFLWLNKIQSRNLRE